MCFVEAMRPNLRLLSSFALSLPLAVAACGGQTFDVAPETDAASDVSSDSSSDVTTDVPSTDTFDGCPTTEPTEGDACNAKTSCTYAPFSSKYCKSSPPMWNCISGKWTHVCTAIPDTGVPDFGGHETSPPSGCPSSIPSDGAPCVPLGLACGYGDDPRPRCRPTSTCKTTGWSTPIGACPPPPTETCPPTEDKAKGQTCTTVGAFCSYGDSRCGCSNCFAGPCGGTPKWACSDPPSDPSCPRAMPNLGVACAKAGLSCVYGSCASGDVAGRKCEGAVWIDVPQACPL